jgi:hypothetical protein
LIKKEAVIMAGGVFKISCPFCVTQSVMSDAVCPRCGKDPVARQRFEKIAAEKKKKVAIERAERAKKIAIVEAKAKAAEKYAKKDQEAEAKAVKKATGKN